MSTRGRILVLDDHPRNVAILTRLLAKDHVVTTAATGEEALTVAEGFRPDVALLDIMLPGIDGYEVCRRLRAMPSTAHCKILMVSAKGLPTERLAGYEAGADDYVVKPFDPDELMAKIRVYLRLKSVEEVERLKSDVLQLFNHETRTPLATILAPLEMLLADEGLSPAQRAFVAMAEDSARRMHEMVEKIAFLGRLHAGSVESEPDRQELAALVHTAIIAVKPFADSVGVTMACDLSAGVLVNVDATLFHRALTAILDNAARHGACPGTVEVRGGVNEGHAWLTVTDHGPGIPEGHLPRVFDGFVMPDVDHHSSGHGLGLATARAIVRRDGGHLSARNAPDGGAVFTLRFPLAEPSAAAAAPQAGAGDRAHA